MKSSMISKGQENFNPCDALTRYRGITYNIAIKMTIILSYKTTSRQFTDVPSCLSFYRFLSRFDQGLLPFFIAFYRAVQNFFLPFLLKPAPLVLAILKV